MTGEIMSLEGLAGLAFNPKKHKKHRKHGKSRKNLSRGGWEWGHYQHRNPGKKHRRGGFGGGGLGSALKAVGLGLAAGVAVEVLNAGYNRLAARYPVLPVSGSGKAGALVGVAAGLGGYMLARKFAPRYAALVPTVVGAVAGSKLVQSGDVPGVSTFVLGAYSEALAARGLTPGSGPGTAGLGLLTEYDPDQVSGLGQGDPEDYL